jgi:hypothetical protein
VNDHKTPFLAVAEAAQSFCRLIEQTEQLGIALWIESLRHVLARLETAMAQFAPGIAPSETDYRPIADLDGRFELYLRLKSYLDRHDEFWSDEDLRAGDGFMSGSLSGNLADIYFELKQGLAYCAAGLEGRKAARRIWREGYHKYWRRHLGEALKHLDDLAGRQS